MSVLVVGIAGGTGSGKTTLTKALFRSLEEHVSIVYHDNYYRRHDELSYEERSKLNYDSPDAFDNDLLVSHLTKLISGKSVECPVYDYSIHNRVDETITINPAKIIIVEGILIFAEPRIRELCDIKLFVDTDADVRIMRRIKRDVVERGRDINSVEKQYLETVKPMHEIYVEPSKRYADIIIPEGGNNIVALDMLIHRIKREVND